MEDQPKPHLPLHQIIFQDEYKGVLAMLSKKHRLELEKKILED